MKHWLLIITAVFLSLSFSPDTFAKTDLPEIDTENYFVQDHADVLSPEATESLNDLGEHLEEGTGAAHLLMTMPTVGKIHRQNYALNILKEYGVINEAHDNGFSIIMNLVKGTTILHFGIP